MFWRKINTADFTNCKPLFFQTFSKKCESSFQDLQICLSISFLLGLSVSLSPSLIEEDELRAALFCFTCMPGKTFDVAVLLSKTFRFVGLIHAVQCHKQVVIIKWGKKVWKLVINPEKYRRTVILGGNREKAMTTGSPGKIRKVGKCGCKFPETL